MHQDGISVPVSVQSSVKWNQCWCSVGAMYRVVLLSRNLAHLFAIIWFSVIRQALWWPVRFLEVCTLAFPLYQVINANEELVDLLLKLKKSIVLTRVCFWSDAHQAFKMTSTYNLSKSWSFLTRTTSRIKKGDVVQTEYKPSARCCR